VRNAAGLALADVSARCGIDQPALSRLENGHTPNPTLDRLRRYAAALGKRLVLTTGDVPETRVGRVNGGRGVAKGREQEYDVCFWPREEMMNVPFLSCRLGFLRWEALLRIFPGE